MIISGRVISPRILNALDLKAAVDSVRAMREVMARESLVPVIDGLRRTILYGLPPDWLSLGAGTASSLVMLICAFILFKRLETGIADIA